MSYRLAFDAGPWEFALAAAALAACALSWPALSALPRAVRVLRVSAWLVLAALVLKPALQRMDDRSLRPRLAVLVDTGPSMHALDDRGVSRLRRAASWLKANRARIEALSEPALFAAGGGGRRLNWEELDGLAPGQEALETGSVVADVLAAGAPPERLWLLSDGAFEALDDPAQLFGRLRAPIDALGTGPLKQTRSVALNSIRCPDFVFLHGRFQISASVEANELAGSELRLRLLSAAKEIASARFSVKLPYEVFQASFSVPAEALGRESYRLEVDGGGVRAVREVGVEVIRQKHRIMYLAGRPSFEYSHLRAQLKGDPNHELVSFVILRNPENASPVADHELSLIPFPATEIFVNNLFQFDLFILENFAYWRFNLPTAYLQNLKRFVAQGGALLVIGGSNAFTKGGYQGSPLEETLPVSLWSNADDFEPGLYKPAVAAPENPLLQLGADKQATAELWGSLPPLDGFSRFAAVRPGASVLLSHPTEKTAAGQNLPIVAVREFGKGKVMLVGTDSTWRWKLGGGQNWKLSSFYARFWSRAVQYLTGSLELKKVKFSPLPDRMPAREPAVLSLHAFDEHFRPVQGVDLDLRVLWKGPGGALRTPPFFEREPGVYQIELTGLSEGRHELRALARYRGQYWGEDEVSFHWEQAKGEAALNRERLKSLADGSGGRYFDLERAELAELLKALPPVKRSRAVLSRSAVWSADAWVWLLAFLLLTEWLLRRRGGLL